MEILSVLEEAKVLRAARELKLPDGSTTLSQMVFPKDTLEWRAAEYQIDPRETDLLMDIVLYESIMPQDPLEVSILFTAETVDEARDIYVQRVLDFKRQIRPEARMWKSNPQKASLMESKGLHPAWVQAITDDALLPIRTGSVMDQDVILEKVRIVAESRDNARRTRDQAPAASRIDVLRASRLARKDVPEIRTGEK